MNAYRSKILTLYKQFLQTAQFITSPNKRFETIGEIKATFRRNSKKKNLSIEQITELISKGETRLSFLRMEIPKEVQPHVDSKLQRFYVNGEGSLVEGEAQGRPRRSFIDQRLDIEDYQRHKRLLDRQHFKDRDKPLRSELNPLHK